MGLSYKKVSTHPHKIVKVGSSSSKSILQCVSNCPTFSLTYYVSYDVTSGVCICGNQVKNEIMTSSSATTKLLSQNFQIYRDADNTDVALIFSDATKNYSAAKEFCSGFLHTRLFVADTRAKSDLVLEHLPDLNTWVGLDDIQVEDDFRWADGSSMTSQQRQELFVHGEPNSDGSEDCVHFDHRRGGFNDARCSMKYTFVCEQVFAG